MRNTFDIPCLPPSVNQMYKVNYRSKSLYLDESVRSFKRTAFVYIPTIKIKDESRYKIVVEYHGKFFNNDGTIKRRDGQNLDKCLYDVIFEKIGSDDKHIFEGHWYKINDEKEFTRVSIEEIPEDGYK